MSECLSLHTLNGTNIQDIDTDGKELSARTHRLSAFTENDVELWYFRDGAWHLFPLQPLTGPDNGLVLTQTYRQPSTLEFQLPDPDGLYATENLNSAYNYNSDRDYDPILDEARKICLRVGTHCYTNLALHRTCTIAGGPVVGSASLLTDGVLGHIVDGSAQFVQIQNGGSVTFAGSLRTGAAITVDLGSVQYIRHTAIRFASLIDGGTGEADRLLATCALPGFLEVSVSNDGSNFTAAMPARPCAQTYSFDGDNIVPSAAGDWEDSVSGQEMEFAHCDINRSARYVRWTFSEQNHIHAVGDPGYFTQFVDEVAVYGGSTYAPLGCNLFTGYMGDQIDFTPQGTIKALVVDVLKKLADNNDTFLTAAYRLTSAGAIELGDIAYSLLTSTAYWKSESDYDTPFTVDEIGWASGGQLTGLQYPLWQGQTNSILGYLYELFNTIGWNFYSDGNGVLQAKDPPTTQRIPDRVCISFNDGNTDVAQCERHRTGKEMRNRVIVQTGKQPTAGNGTITTFDPNSVRRYGTRTTRITDPLASTTDLRRKVASYFLRDFANNLQTLSNTIRPQFETAVKQVFGFRAPARPNLYSLAADIDDGPGEPTPAWLSDKRKQELWSLTSIKHNITYGKWFADCEWIPYVCQGPPVVDFTSIELFFTNALRCNYTPVNLTTYPDVRQIRAYISSTGEYRAYTNAGEKDANAGGTLDINGLTPGQEYWIYLVSVDIYGQESLPSAFLSAVAGSESQSITGYTITDFTIGGTLTQGPDAQGYYTYSFLALWTAPLLGFTQSWIGAYVGGSPPANPDNRSSWPIHDDTFDYWNPNRIAQGLTWDDATPGQLDFVINFRSKSNLVGLKIWFRIWNSSRTRAWLPVPGNSDFTIVLPA